MQVSENFLQTAEQFLRDNPGPAPSYLLFLDIAGFRSVRRFYGKDAGDRLMLRLCDYLQSAPGIELCFRFSFDCCLCLYRPEGGADISALCDQLCQQFLDSQKEAYPACRLKIACGICPAESENMELSAEGADLARLTSKGHGSLHAVFYDADKMRQTAALYDLDRELNLALVEEKFCFYLQPKVDLDTGKVIGAEASARRILDDGTLCRPGDFLAHMETSGAVVDLDLLIFRLVCEALSKRIKKGLPVLPISVNLSPLHARKPETAADFGAIAEEFHVPPALLEFEIPETILLEDFANARDFIGRLRAFGCRVGIDDFGSGYTGVNIWQDLTFDYLKLDKNLLSGQETLKKRNDALIPNIISIGHRLEIPIYCEGVETREQCRYLKRLGCFAAQGYYFEKPLPPEDFFSAYQEQNGEYKLPYLSGPASERQESAGQASRSGREDALLSRRVYAVLVLLSGLFLAACIAATCWAYRDRTQRRFNDMVIENLTASMSGQREAILSEIDEVTNILTALATVIPQINRGEMIDAYLSSVNATSSRRILLYNTSEYFDEKMRDGEIGGDDAEAIRRLRAGEIVLSDVVFSDRMGGGYYWSVGVPVFQDETFIGALRGVVGASGLTSTFLYPTTQGQVVSSRLTDSEGVMIQTSSENQEEEMSIYELLSRRGSSDSALDSVRAAYASIASGQDAMPPAASGGASTACLFLGARGGPPYYLSLTNLGVNGWYFSVIFRADKAAIRSGEIIHDSILYALLLLIAVLAVFSAHFFYLGHVRRRVSVEQRRYLLLEQFSDTVLFDYDCREDTVRFTPNAPQLLRVHELIQKNFRNNVENRYIYAGDLGIVWQMLTGQLAKGPQEIRIRCQHPVENKYFWALIQFHYLYERGNLISIVGKITDIDEQKQQEDHLKEISQRDGLTGLYNKSSAEQQIIRLLAEQSLGLLFMIDLDDFKHINDIYGHATGDQVLRYIAECMRKVFRAQDIIGRAGGDELIAFMAGTDDRQLAADKTAHLMELVRQCAQHGLPELSLSIGISRYPDDGSCYDTLFSFADQAMYEAKRSGKNSSRFYSA